MTESPIKPHRSESIFQGKFLSVRKDWIQLNGQDVSREVVGHAPVAAVVAMFDTETTVLVSQYRHAVQQTLLEIPAGIIDKDEDPLEAAKRELQEETGYIAKNWQFLGKIFPTPGFSDEEIYLYLATQLDAGDQNLDFDEDIEVVLMDLSSVNTAIQAGDIQDGKSVSGLLLAQLNPQ